MGAINRILMGVYAVVKVCYKGSGLYSKLQQLSTPTSRKFSLLSLLVCVESVASLISNLG